MLTVLLATHNGARTLPRVLSAYEQLIAPPQGWRVVVVDNASSDDTPSVLRHFAERLPLHALHTTQRGKNVALNIGLAHAEGELVVLTDDDAVPQADWLQALRATAARHSAYDVFGGQIDPVWPPAAPEWIERLVPLGATFAITPPGAVEGPIAAAQVWGPNMAVRRAVFAAGHRFDEGVGPQAGQYMMGSEVEFTCRVERLGHRAWFAASAKVGHLIRPHQIERKWIVQRGYRLGRHMFHQERELFAGARGLLRGAPRWKYRRLLGEYWNSAVARVGGNFDRQFKADWEISFLRGYLAEAARCA
jgi:L-malate glycosyltransferase